jgi:hypothetical protein
VAQPPGQHRGGTRACGVFLLTGEYPQLAVEHEERLVVPLVNVAAGSPDVLLGRRLHLARGAAVD